MLAAAAAWLEKADQVPAAALSLFSLGLQEPSRKHHLQALLQVKLLPAVCYCHRISKTISI